MLHNMDRIRGSLANIETGIAEIQQGSRPSTVRTRSSCSSSTMGYVPAATDGTW
jgi:hypothetical protein